MEPPYLAEHLAMLATCYAEIRLTWYQRWSQGTVHWHSWQLYGPQQPDLTIMSREKLVNQIFNGPDKEQEGVGTMHDSNYSQKELQTQI